MTSPASLVLLVLSSLLLSATHAFFFHAPSTITTTTTTTHAHTRTCTRMMAQRHYTKWTRADFLLKSSLATAAVIPVIKSGAGARAANQEQLQQVIQQQQLLQKQEQRGDKKNDDDAVDSPLASSVPLRFQGGKTQNEALMELQEVVSRLGGRLTKTNTNTNNQNNHNIIRAAFRSSSSSSANSNDVFFVFDTQKSGHLHASTGTGREEMRLLNFVASELAGKGGWHTTGFPLTCDHAMAYYA